MTSKLKRLFEQTIVGTYRARGYEYQYIGARHFKFSNAQDNIEVLYRIPPYVSKCVQITIFIRYGYQWTTLHMSKLKYFQDTARDTIYFTNQQEFLDACRQLTTQAFLVLDHLETIVDSLIPRKLSYYELLSQDTHQQAQAFATKNHLEFLCSPENFKWAQEWLQLRLFKYYDTGSKKKVFDSDLNHIIPFCAYVGELLCIKENGMWLWNDPASERRVYGVSWAPRDGKDPLNSVIVYLNFASEVNNCSLCL